jgi:hypothetical protein
MWLITVGVYPRLIALGAPTGVAATLNSESHSFCRQSSGSERLEVAVAAANAYGRNTGRPIGVRTDEPDGLPSAEGQR